MHLQPASLYTDPLFAYVSYTAVHTPNQAEPEWLDRCSHLTDTKRREHCALMVGLDDAIKNVTETALKELGNNVIVVVSTDNGGDYHHGAVNEPFRGNKVSGFEGGIRGMGFVADLSEGQQHLGDLSHRTGRREGGYEGLMHIADWLPTFRGIAESAKPMDPANAGPASATDVPLGFGHNMHAALRSGGVSPRTDAVGCLDDKTNFVSYIKGDYKLMVGYFGPDGWSEEEDTEDGRGRELSFHEVIEAAVHDALDWYFQTRDATIMWKEIASLMLRGLFVGMQGGSDLFMADKQLLGECIVVMCISAFDVVQVCCVPRPSCCFLKRKFSRRWTLKSRLVEGLVDPYECVVKLTHID